jgi:VWFA-related protein
MCKGILETHAYDRLRNAFRAVALGVCFCAAFHSSGLGQESDGEPVFRSSTRLVVLDVVVNDAKGKSVSDLKGQDFTILEDGQEQKMASFEPPSALALASTTDRNKAASREASIPARNILVLDELNTEALDEAYARQSLEKYLRKHGPVLDQPTSLIIIGEKQIEFAHDYTRDAVAIKEALKGHHPGLPFSKMTGGAYGSVERLVKTLWVVEQIASANLHYAGRKNLIWVGSGFPELTDRSLDIHDRQNFERAIRQMAGILFDSRVAVYTINPEGLQVAPAALEDSFGDLTSGELLFEGLAEQTGGKIFRLQNQLDQVIADSAADGATYYTISYYPTNRNWDGKFRKLHISVGRGGLKVSARNGYYAIADSARTQDEADDAVAQALMSPIPYRALDVRASVKPQGDLSGVYAVRVDSGALSWQTLASGKRRCQVDAVTATMGTSLSFSTHKVRQLEAVLDEQQYRKISGKSVTFSFVAELPKDTHFVKIVIRDPANGNIGSAQIDKDAIKNR